MEMTLTGTGTSHGVPVIGCSCAVCSSTDPRDNRNRCSAYIKSPASIVIDTGPEFRIQALKFKIKKLDAVLITHDHADHLNGLDDLRVFSHTKSVGPSKTKTNETEGSGLPIYTNRHTIHKIKERFEYIFTPVKEGGSKPKLFFVDVSDFNGDSPLNINGLSIIPVPLMHGSLETCGWIFNDTSNENGSIAYLTDCNSIPEKSFMLIKKSGPVKHLIIDALRIESHSTHFSFMEALNAAERIGAEHTWFTHMTHNLAHTQVQSYIDEHLDNFPGLKKIVSEGGSVSPAYDSLSIEA